MMGFLGLWGSKKEEIEIVIREVQDLAASDLRREYHCSKCGRAGHNIRTCSRVHQLEAEVVRLAEDLREARAEAELQGMINSELRNEIERLREQLIACQTRLGPRAMPVDSWE